MIAHEFIVKNVKANVDLFCKHLGFKLEIAEPSIEKYHWAQLMRKNDRIMFFDLKKMQGEFVGFPNRLGSTGLTLIQYSLKEVKRLYKVIKEQTSLKMFEELCVKPYGTTEFGFYLPDNYIIIITS